MRPESRGVQLPLDIIWDFNPAEGDKIVLANLAQDVGFGVQHLTFVTGLFTGGMGEVRCEQDPSHPQDVTVLIHFSELNADAGITVHTTGNFTPNASWLTSEYIGDGGAFVHTTSAVILALAG